MSSPINELLKSPDRGIGDARGVLPKLYRKILYDLNIGPGEFYQRMLAFLNDSQNGFSGDNKRRSYERSNFIKEISRENMSFKVFAKGLRFLRPTSVRLAVELNWRKNTTVHHIDFKVCDTTLEEFMEHYVSDSDSVSGEQYLIDKMMERSIQDEVEDLTDVDFLDEPDFDALLNRVPAVDDQ